MITDLQLTSLTSTESKPDALGTGDFREVSHLQFHYSATPLGD